MAGNYSYDPEKRIFCGEDDDGNAILIQGDRAFEFAEVIENQSQLSKRLSLVDELTMTLGNGIEELRCEKADQGYVDDRIIQVMKYQVLTEEKVANIAEEVVKQYLFDLIEKRRSMKQEKASVTDEELFELLDILNITEVE